jgi:flagellin
MLSIQTNVNAMVAQENLRVTTDFQGRTIARLTSGYRINQSGDDAAGLAVANKYRSEVSELTQGVRNANDGLSTLQIIDGGLNNVSKILDRLKTLATQSATDTFTGDRNTLNNEYQDLLSEINRQADHIGLGVGSTGGRNNTNINVYVGGAQVGSPSVNIALSGSSNRVDSAGLGLSGTSIAGGGATSFSNSNDLSTATNLLSGSTSQAFTFNIAKAGGPAFSTTVTVTGDSDGISGADVVSQLNSALNAHGISASLNSSTGALQFSGDTAFTASATASGTNPILSANGTVSNSSNYSVAPGGTFATIAGGAEVITVKVGTATASVSLANGTTKAQALQQLNDSFNALGIYAVNDAAGTNIEFQSKAAFSYTASSTVAAEGIFSTNVGTMTAATAPSASGNATSSANAAINAITNAVTSLAFVQGKVGTAQNKISYAIQLAQSQITNFSAAESRIRDADIAQEAANLTKAQVLSQASMAAMAQANSAPQAVLSLLRG